MLFMQTCIEMRENHIHSEASVCVSYYEFVCRIDTMQKREKWTPTKTARVWKSSRKQI